MAQNNKSISKPVVASTPKSAKRAMEPKVKYTAAETESLKLPNEQIESLSAKTSGLEAANNLKLPVIDFDNNSFGEIDLAKEVFGEKVRADILNRVVEWQRSKRRAGTHHTKGISDISGTTKKMYKQKGTGRARHGSARAGHFRKGAVLLGPKFRSHEYSIQKKVRDLALKMAVSLKCKESKLIVLNDLNIKDHKTKNLATKLAKLGIGSGLFIAIDYEKDQHFARAYRNIKNVDALPVKGINVYDILNHDYLLFTKDGVAALEKRLIGSSGHSV